MVVADGCHQLVLGLRAVERDERLIEDKPFVHNTGDDLLVLVVSVHQGDAAVDVLLILDELAHILENDVVDFVSTLSVCLGVENKFHFPVGIELDGSRQILRIFLEYHALGSLFHLFLFYLLCHGWYDPTRTFRSSGSILLLGGIILDLHRRHRFCSWHRSLGSRHRILCILLQLFCLLLHSFSFSLQSRSFRFRFLSFRLYFFSFRLHLGSFCLSLGCFQCLLGFL